MSNQVILTCAVTGGHNNQAKHPDYPITPEQIAKNCTDAARAGAAIVHIHVRDPETGMRSGEPALFREVVKRIRDSDVDVLINLTTSEGARFSPGEVDASVGGPGTTLVQPLDRLQHIEELRPDICTLDVGSFNFGETIFVNTPAHLRIMAARIQELGVKPELEVFEPGHIMFAHKLIEEGLIEGKPMFQLCLGIPHASPATAEILTVMKNLLPENANWSAFGISRFEFAIVAQAASQGGNCRVGLEDNLYLNKDEFASNLQLVERAVRIIRELGREPATATQAAERLGINRH
ncbi:MAG: 3-keto-5-aminohexanoate cleavage protein [Gammaproteobacteria bacterium]|nr:3-keto-5-aminohexanoate cleavage protein [Gammaproteobacteria bacterium]MCZ6578803.1 3-keto-5-aminohexanoate cleavage protein [Gammaproteobacteria bacterium]MCZ6668385.1 3-keto-5-aminohexanoate cleavage protein [Gammaproteobacteria bacterium]